MKIVIVDDEVIVRVGIKTLIPWEEYGHTIVGEAKNGIEALELIEKNGPDIVLADILMPKMSGLELIAVANEKGYNCKFIILSCLNEVEYLRKAMKLGARDYLIKTSVQPQEMLDTIQKVSGEIMQGRYHTDLGKTLGERGAFKEALRNIIYTGDISQANKNSLIDIFHTEIAFFILVKIMHHESIKKRFENKEKDFYIRSVENILAEHISKHGQLHVLEKGRGLMAAVAVLGKSDTDTITSDRFSIVLKRAVDTVSMIMGFKILVGSSKQISSIDELKNGYEQARKSINILFFTAEKNYYIYKNHKTDSVAKKNILSEIKKIKDSLFVNIANQDFNEIMTGLSKLRKVLCHESSMTSETDKIKKHFIDIFYWIVTQLKKDFKDISESYKDFTDIYSKLMDCENIDELYDCTSSFCTSIYETIYNQERTKTETLIFQAKKYIDTNLDKNLSLDDTAGLFNLSAGYFGKTFKKVTGLSFTDYLLGKRIEKAKLLMKNNQKLWVIAKEVGYLDFSSFSRAFKNKTGMPPSRYREKFAAKYPEMEN